MIFFFLFLLRVAYHHQAKGGGPRGTPSVEAYCPFGGIENLYQFLTTGGFIRRIEPSAMIILAAVIVLTLLFSRGFCGWICPFGSVQEWIGVLGRKILRKRFNPTGRWDNALRYLKYVVLAVIVTLTWHTGTLVFRSYDPFLAFFHLGNGLTELPWAYAILGVVILGSLVVERFFCKYACPLGAVLGITGKLGLTKVRRDPTGCKNCNLCQQKCHAHIDFLSVTEIRSAECNHCLDCVVDCPKPNVLSVRGPRWRFSHPVYASLMIVGLFGMIGVSQLTGSWQTRPQRISLMDSSGKLDPENIRGWMTLQEISQGYGIPINRLYAISGIPAKVPPQARLNTIAREYKVDFEPEALRGVVRGLLTGEPVKKAAKKKQHSGREPEVRGFMTLNEIALKTGVPKDYLVKTLKLPKEIDGRQPLREWMHDNGLTIQDVRDTVAGYREKNEVDLQPKHK
jgi:polyferredoxin